MALALLFFGARHLSAWALAVAAAVAAIIVGASATRRAQASAATSSGAWMARAGTVLGLIAVVYIGLFVVEGMRRTGRHSSPEVDIMYDIRALLSAEDQYKEGIGKGNFCSLSCLATPALCVPGYTGPPLLAAPFIADSDYRGFRRRFHAGTVAPEPAALSPQGRFATFAYTAVPMKSWAGTRGLCADSTGRICSTTDGSAPAVKDGLCDPGCTELR